MSLTRMSVICSLLLLVTASGCSGSRLRDLLPGNDRFVTLEDLDRLEAEQQSQVATAEEPAKAGGPLQTARSLFVSRSTESSGEKAENTDASAETESRSRMLGLGKLLDRPRQAHEVDPFLGIDDHAADDAAGDSTPAAMVNTESRAPGRPQMQDQIAAASEKSKLPPGTADALAEAFAEFTADAEKPVSKESEVRTAAVGQQRQPTVRDKSTGRNQVSDDLFAEFLADADSDRPATESAEQVIQDTAMITDFEPVDLVQAEVKPEPKPAAAAAFEKTAGPTTAAPTADDDDILRDFDALLAGALDSKPAGQPGKQAAQERSTSTGNLPPSTGDGAAYPLVTKTDKAAKQAFDSLLTKHESSPRRAVVESVDRELAAQLADDLFAQAAARHGFVTGHKADSATDAWAPADVQSFEWQTPAANSAVSTKPSEDRVKAAAPSPRIQPRGFQPQDFGPLASVPEPPAEVTQPVLMVPQTAAAIPAPVPAPAPLRIPEPDVAEPRIRQASASRELEAAFSDDLFAEDSLTLAALPTAETQTAASATAASDDDSSLFGLSTGRLLFLLVGVAVVLALLFYPERATRWRQNRD